MGGKNVEVQSAGIEAHGKNPRAIAVMAKASGTEAQIKTEFRATRDDIEKRVRVLLAELV